MNTAELLESYKKVSDATKSAIGKPLPPLMQEGYGVILSEPIVCISEQQVWSEIATFGKSCGWFGYQSGNQHQLVIAAVIAKKEYGNLLNAELTNNDGQSMHIRYNGHGGWIVMTYSYTPGGDYIVDEVSHLSSFDKTKKLNYLRFWKLASDETTIGVNPVFACFTGFGD